MILNQELRPESSELRSLLSWTLKLLIASETTGEVSPFHNKLGNAAMSIIFPPKKEKKKYSKKQQ